MVAVSDLLAVAELRLRLTHGADLSRRIRWVATTELAEPERFVEAGEVVLTTGLQTRRWTRRWDVYVAGLARAGIAAIGIGTGVSYDRPPAALVTACARHDMNLIEVPRETPFVAISREVSRLLTDEEEQDVRAALRTQRLLIAAAAKPDPTAKVLSTLAGAFGGAATIGADGAVLLGPFGARGERLAAADVAAEARRLCRSSGPQAATVTGSTDTVVVQPIGVGRRQPSCLAVAGPSPLTEGQRTTIIAAVALLSLIDEQRRGAIETLRYLRARAVEFAVTGQSELAEAVLGVEPGAPALPHRLRVLRAAGPAERVDDALAGLDDLLAAQYRGEVCVLAEPRDAAAAAERITRAGLRVGVGSTARPTAAAESYRTAGVALAQAVPGAVIGWDDIVRRGPLGLIDHDAASAFAAALLGDLTAEQRDLLRCFLIHHGSVLKVADELDVHRNTVRNRLRAIEAKLPGSLDDPETRVGVWIALQSLPPGD